MNRRIYIDIVALSLVACLTAAALGAAPLPPDHPTLAPARAASPENKVGPVAALQERLAKGELKLEFEPGQGYLRSLLRWLQAPVSSQVLVFSKTSAQPELVSPETPRAFYFSDQVYVGWVPKSDVIEISEVDPANGATFYTLNQTPDFPAALKRRDDCLQCHNSLKTMGVPGHLMGSTFTAPDGHPFSSVEDYRGGHRSPLRLRWGGWYVTGTHASDVHLGNAFLTDEMRPESVDHSAGANLTSLPGRCSTGSYLGAHSDIVALLVFEHQVRMQNLIARLNFETREALGIGSQEIATLPSPITAACSQVRSQIAKPAEALLEYMLFRDEAPLKGPVRGMSTFADDFQKGGPRDSKGRSLRTLDLKQRLLRYPCSYLIYSDAFDALPLAAQEYLWQRLEEILTGVETAGAYAGMAHADRHAIFEILQETKPAFARWTQRRSAQLMVR